MPEPIKPPAEHGRRTLKSVRSQQTPDFKQRNKLGLPDMRCPNWASTTARLATKRLGWQQRLIPELSLFLADLGISQLTVTDSGTQWSILCAQWSQRIVWGRTSAMVLASFDVVAAIVTGCLHVVKVNKILYPRVELNAWDFMGWNHLSSVASLRSLRRDYDQQAFGHIWTTLSLPFADYNRFYSLWNDEWTWSWGPGLRQPWYQYCDKIKLVHHRYVFSCLYSSYTGIK